VSSSTDLRGGGFWQTTNGTPPILNIKGHRAKASDCGLAVKREKESKADNRFFPDAQEGKNVQGKPGGKPPLLKPKGEGTDVAATKRKNKGVLGQKHWEGVGAQEK